MRILIATFILAVTFPLAHSQQSPKPSEHAPQQTIAPSSASAEDVQKMKSLIYQMQRNLASVSTAQDPLKHQFELEIEMWQLEIARLERHLNSSAEKK